MKESIKLIKRSIKLILCSAIIHLLILHINLNFKGHDSDYSKNLINETEHKVKEQEYKDFSKSKVNNQKVDESNNEEINEVNNQKIEIIRYFETDEISKLYFPQIYPKGTNKKQEPVTDSSFLDIRIGTRLEYVNRDLWSTPIMERNRLYNDNIIVNENGKLISDYSDDNDNENNNINTENMPYLTSGYEIMYQSNDFVSIILKMTISDNNGNIISNKLEAYNYLIAEEKFVYCDLDSKYYKLDMLNKLNKDNITIKSFNGNILTQSDFFYVTDLLGSANKIYLL